MIKCDKMALQRFGVGFVSALCVPTLKLGQNGVDTAGFGLTSYLGFMIPVAILAAVTGLYAVFVEHGETDMKRLFRMCVTLPAFVTTMASGGTTVDVGITEAQAKESVKKITCSKELGLRLGVVSAMGVLTDKKYKRYWLLSTSTQTDRCVMVNDECFFIEKSVNKLTRERLHMDKFTCEIVVKE